MGGTGVLIGGAGVAVDGTGVWVGGIGVAVEDRSVVAGIAMGEGEAAGGVAADWHPANSTRTMVSRAINRWRACILPSPDICINRYKSSGSRMANRHTSSPLRIDCTTLIRHYRQARLSAVTGECGTSS